MSTSIEYLEEKENRTYGAYFFKENGLLPDRLPMHRFLTWLADVCEGAIHKSHPDATTNTKATVKAILNYHMCLNMALAYFNAPIPRAQLTNTNTWIKNELSRDQDLNRDAIPKHTSYHHDVIRVIECIWSSDAIRLVKSIHNMLNATLALNLLLDGCGRIGELLPVDKAAVDAGRYLTWECVEF